MATSVTDFLMIAHNAVTYFSPSAECMVALLARTKGRLETPDGRARVGVCACCTDLGDVLEGYGSWKMEWVVQSVQLQYASSSSGRVFFSNL